METIFIGDIHGCSREFSALLDHVSPGRGDRLILLDSGAHLIVDLIPGALPR